MARLILSARSKGLATGNDTTNVITTVVSPDGTIDGAFIEDGSIAESALADSVLQTATVTLTAAQVNALFTTPISIIAAPGAGKLTQVTSCALQYNYDTTAFTIGSATNLALKYTDASGTSATTTAAVTGFLDQTADELRVLPLASSAYEPVANAAVVLTLAGANVSAGVGTLVVTVAYRVITLA
jgi:hypothetical protein